MSVFKTVFVKQPFTMLSLVLMPHVRFWVVELKMGLMSMQAADLMTKPLLCLQLKMVTLMQSPSYWTWSWCQSSRKMLWNSPSLCPPWFWCPVWDFELFDWKWRGCQCRLHIWQPNPTHDSSWKGSHKCSCLSHSTWCYCGSSRRKCRNSSSPCCAFFLKKNLGSEEVWIRS